MLVSISFASAFDALVSVFMSDSTVPPIFMFMQLSILKMNIKDEMDE